jgi:uncharacterized protein YecA (UPF0149 family)
MAMDMTNGILYTGEEFMKRYNSIALGEAIHKANLEGEKVMSVLPTEEQIKKKKIGRNENCPCGSGKKFKKCCLYDNWKSRFEGGQK